MYKATINIVAFLYFKFRLLRKRLRHHFIFTSTSVQSYAYARKNKILLSTSTLFILPTQGLFELTKFYLLFVIYYLKM